jgi:hypothetical protein
LRRPTEISSNRDSNVLDKGGQKQGHNKWPTSGLPSREETLTRSLVWSERQHEENWPTPDYSSLEKEHPDFVEYNEFMHFSFCATIFKVREVPLKLESDDLLDKYRDYFENNGCFFAIRVSYIGQFDKLLITLIDKPSIAYDNTIFDLEHKQVREHGEVWNMYFPLQFCINIGEYGNYDIYYFEVDYGEKYSTDIFLLTQPDNNNVLDIMKVEK